MGINEFIKIGSRIKELRISKGISQKDMAKMLEINRSTYSNYENDIREPNREVIEKIAEVLEIPVSKLFGDAFIVDTNDTFTSKDYLFEKLLNEIGYSIDYIYDEDQNMDDFFVLHNGISFPITQSQIDDLQKHTESYLRWQLFELEQKYKNNIKKMKTIIQKESE